MLDRWHREYFFPAAAALAIMAPAVLLAGPFNTLPPPVPLQLKLPMPTLKGMPDDLPKGPHIEPLPEKPPTPPMVPAGVTNVAFGRNVTTSAGHLYTGTLEQIVDGKKEAFDDHVVELHRGVQWIQVDLGHPFRIYAIALWHDFRLVQFFHDVVLQVADDSDFTQNVRTLFNNDRDNSAGRGVGAHKEYFATQYGRVVEAKGELARYVRSYSNGNHRSVLNGYGELEVYALPSGSADPGLASTNEVQVPLRLKLPRPTLK